MRFFDLQTGKLLVGCPNKLRFELALIELQSIPVLFKGRRKDIASLPLHEYVRQADDLHYWNYLQPQSSHWYQKPLESFRSALRALDQLNGFRAAYLIIVADLAPGR